MVEAGVAGVDLCQKTPRVQHQRQLLVADRNTTSQTQCHFSPRAPAHHKQNATALFTNADASDHKLQSALRSAAEASDQNRRALPP
eukprot:1422527-Rhodomonas_salina.1